MTDAIDPLDDWQAARGERWLLALDANEAMLAPLGEAILAHAGFGSGERVIDIGCGGGATSRAIAHAVGARGDVLGVDIAPSLIAIFRVRCSRQPSAAFVLSIRILRMTTVDRGASHPTMRIYPTMFPRMARTGELGW